MKILVIKTQTGLRPVYDSDFEIYSKIPLNEQFEIEYTKKRNVKFHRKFFALLKLAFENQNIYSILDEMRYDILIILGFYEEKENKITGEITKKAKSISFSSMDETEFNKIYENAKDFISGWLGIENETIENEILQYY